MSLGKYRCGVNSPQKKEDKECELAKDGLNGGKASDATTADESYDARFSPLIQTIERDADRQTD